MSTHTCLHIHCGDASARMLHDSGVPGNTLVWREIYIEGPVPGDVTEKDLQKIRAHYLSQSVGIPYDRVLQGTHARYETLKNAGSYDEVVLWFDACMFDQTIMTKVLDLCRRQEWLRDNVTLICVSDRGLGAYRPEEFPALFELRQHVDREQFSLAQDAWKAFTSDTPKALEDLLAQDCSALPFLADALRRFLQQYPSVQNGLNRLENQTLFAVASGTAKLNPIFREVSSHEEQPFLGDTSQWKVIYQLATCPNPVLRVSGPDHFESLTQFDPENYDQPTGNQIDQWDISLTETGKKVLEGEVDFVHLNGIDRWLGGVHLSGEEARWRWNSTSSRMQDIFSRGA